MAFSEKQIRAAQRKKEGGPENNATSSERLFRYCPQCDAMADDRAASCANCGRELTIEQPTTPSATPVLTEADRHRIYEEEKARLEARRKIKAEKSAAMVIIALSLIGILWVYGKLSRPAKRPARAQPSAEEVAQREAEREAKREKSNCEDSVMAYIMSQRPVESRLKAPSTATFPWASDTDAQYLGDCRHRVHAYVDSQNSFGAMIRTHYIATLHYVGQDKWALEDLQFPQ